MGAMKLRELQLRERQMWQIFGRPDARSVAFTRESVELVWWQLRAGLRRQQGGKRR